MWKQSKSIFIWGFLGGSVVKKKKKSTCNSGAAGDASLIPSLGRSPGGGNGNPLQCSCLGNLMDRGAWWAAAPGLQSQMHWATKTFTFTLRCPCCSASCLKGYPSSAELLLHLHENLGVSVRFSIWAVYSIPLICVPLSSTTVSILVPTWEKWSCPVTSDSLWPHAL